MVLPKFQPTLGAYVNALFHRFDSAGATTASPQSPKGSSQAPIPSSHVDTTSTLVRSSASSARPSSSRSFEAPQRVYSLNTPAPPPVNKIRKPKLAPPQPAVLDLPEVVTPATRALLDHVYPEVVQPEPRQVLHMPSVSDFAVASSASSSAGVVTSSVVYQPFDELVIEEGLRISKLHCRLREPLYIQIDPRRPRVLEVHKRGAGPLVTILCSERFVPPAGLRVQVIKTVQYIMASSFRFPDDMELQVRVPPESKYSFTTPPMHQGSFVELP